MAKWKVYTLDVWGHAHTDCAEYGCRCAKSDYCECEGFQVNDRFKAGTVDLSDEAPDAEVWCALIEAGFAKGPISAAEFDGDDGFISIDEAETGMPVFQLERLEGV